MYWSSILYATVHKLVELKLQVKPTILLTYYPLVNLRKTTWQPQFKPIGNTNYSVPHEAVQVSIIECSSPAMHEEVEFCDMPG